MENDIQKKWAEAIRHERYEKRHFLSQSPQLAMQLIRALKTGLPDALTVLHDIVEYTHSSSLSRDEISSSFFHLRDIFGRLLIERPIYPRELLYLLRRNCEQFLLRLDQLFEEDNRIYNRHARGGIESHSGDEGGLRLDAGFLIEDASQAILQRFGYAMQTIAGKPFAQLFSPSSQSILKFAREQLIAGRRLRLELELEAITHLGQRFQVLVLLQRSGRRTDSPYRVRIDDLTVRDEAINVLNLTLMALESAGEGIVITEPRTNGRILFVNKALEKMSGYSRNSLLGKSFSFLLGERYDRSELDNIFRASLKGGWEGELLHFDRLGNSYPVQLHTRPVRQENGEIIALVGIERNLSRRKKQEAQLASQTGRLTFLQELSAILSRSLDLAATLDNFAAHLQNSFPHEGVDILIPLEDTRHYFRLFYTSSAMEDQELRRDLLHMEDLPFYRNLTENRDSLYSLTAENYPQAPYFKRMKLNQIRHLVYLPIFFSSELIAIVVLRYRDCTPFSSEACDFLDQIANQLTIALKNFIHLDQIKRSNKKLELISRLFSRARETRSTTTMLRRTAQDIATTFGYDRVAFYRLRNNGKWKVQAEYSEEGPGFPAELEIFGDSDFPGVWIDCFSEYPFEVFLERQLKSPQARFATWLTEPSSFRGKIAVLAIANTYPVDLSYRFHTEIMQAILRELTLAVDHIALFQQTIIAEKEWETTFNEVQIGLAVVDQNLYIRRANRTFWAMFRPGHEQSPNPLAYQEVFFGQDAELFTADSLDKLSQSTIEWYDAARRRIFVRRFFPLLSKKKEFHGGIIIIEDVSEAREKERHIRYLSQFPEINPNLVLSLSLSGEVLYFNPASKKTLLELELDPGRPEQLIPVSLLFELKNGKLESNRPHSYIQDIDEHVFQFIAYTLEGGDQIYLYGMEITERLNLQNKLIQTERVRAMGEMAAGVAHEFNNLLTIILGRAQLMLLKNSEPAPASQLKVIEKAALDGAQIVKRLQELTRRKRRKEFQSVRLNEIIHDSLLYSAQKLKIETQVKGQDTQIHTELDESVVVPGNPIELKEVFTNLIFNAFDAMPGGGELFLQTRREGDTVEVRVRDTGSGIPASVRKKVFDPFFTTKGERGTGLGLSLVYKIITAHRGTIQMHSEPDQGTEFVITLPTSDREPEKARPAEQVQLNRMTDLNLLVIDDELELLETIREVLQLKFHRVDMASSGPEALKQAAHTSYDLVLTDLGMPGMSGWEVAREMKKLNEACRVILVTGWGMQAEEEMKNHDYVDSIISKPYDLQYLLVLIDKFMSNSHEKQLT